MTAKQVAKIALVSIACGAGFVAVASALAVGFSYAIQRWGPGTVLAYLLSGIVLGVTLVWSWNHGALSDEEIRRRQLEMKREFNRIEGLAGKGQQNRRGS